MQRNSPLFVLFITIFIDLLGFGIIIPILPTYAQELGAGSVMIGLLVTIYSIMNFLFGPFWGTLSDRIGRRPVILISIAITAFSYVLLAGANTVLLLFIARFFAGIGSANISAAQAYVTDISTPENRAQSLGLIGAAFGLGFIIGPPVGGLLKTHLGMEWVGGVTAALCIFNLVVAYLMLPESVTEKSNRPGFMFDPFTDLLKELQKPVVRELFWLNFMYIAAFSMMQVTVALFWKEHDGLTEAQIGYTFAFMGLVSAIVQGGLTGKLTARFGEKKLLRYGIFIMAFGVLMIPFVPPGLFVPCGPLSISLVGLGISLMSPAITSLISQTAAPHERGQTMGLMQSFGSLARAAGPAVGGLLYGFDYHFPYFGAALLMVVCWVLTGFVTRAYAAARL